MRAWLMVAVVFATHIISTHAGGWAVITVEDLPERIVAAQDVTLRFSVRQHGQRLLSGLQPRVGFRSGDRQGGANASPDARAGYYVATLRIPEPGRWTLTIFSGFVTSNLELNPIDVVAGTTPPTRVPAAERGEDLFVAKGCASCHYHAAIGATPIARVGADLSAKRYPVALLGKLLADPSLLPPVNGLWTMPKLDLKPQEISALAAFINQQ